MTEEEINELALYLEIRFTDTEDPMQAHKSVWHWFAKLYSVIPDMAGVDSYLAAWRRAAWQKEKNEKEIRVAELEELLNPGVK